MRIYIGCDDSGFAMKQVIMDLLDNKKIPFIDCGSGPEPSRYPYYAAKVAAAVSEGEASTGILICGSGIGMSIAANKYPGVRAAAVSDSYTAYLVVAFSYELAIIPYYIHHITLCDAFVHFQDSTREYPWM